MCFGGLGLSSITDITGFEVEDIDPRMVARQEGARVEYLMRYGFKREVETLVRNRGNMGSGYKVEEPPIKLRPYRIDKAHGLQQLTQGVIDEMFGGTYDGLGSISWTDKPYQGYYGKFDSHGNHIKINVYLCNTGRHWKPKL